MSTFPYSPLTIEAVRREVDILAAVIADEVVTTGTVDGDHLVKQYVPYRASWLIRVSDGSRTSRPLATRLLEALSPPTNETGAPA